MSMAFVHLCHHYGQRCRSTTLLSFEIIRHWFPWASSTEIEFKGRGFEYRVLTSTSAQLPDNLRFPLGFEFEKAVCV